MSGGHRRLAGAIRLSDLRSRQATMNYPTPFLHELKQRAADRCECERSGCHEGQGRCAEKLIDEPGGAARWSPVLTGERLTFPPAASNYIALCGTCAVPRAGKRHPPD